MVIFLIGQWTSSIFQQPILKGINPPESALWSILVFLSPGYSPEFARCFFDVFSQEVFYVMFYVCVCVLWQHSRFSGVCLWHGGRGQHIHRAFQRAEIPRLHLDAISWREGSQAKVQQQLINQTHTQTDTYLSLFFFSPLALTHTYANANTHPHKMLYGCCISASDVIYHNVLISRAFWSHVASWAFFFSQGSSHCVTSVQTVRSPPPLISPLPHT